MLPFATEVSSTPCSSKCPTSAVVLPGLDRRVRRGSKATVVLCVHKMGWGRGGGGGGNEETLNDLGRCLLKEAEALWDNNTGCRFTIENIWNLHVAIVDESEVVPFHTANKKEQHHQRQRGSAHVIKSTTMGPVLIGHHSAWPEPVARHLVSNPSKPVGLGCNHHNVEA